MRRYRTLLLVVLIGIIPAAIALSLSLYLLIPPEEEEVALEQEPVVIPDPEPVIPSVEVLAVARDLPAGTLLTPDDLTYVPLEEQDVLSSHFRQDPDTDPAETPSVVGTAIRIPLLAGMPLTDAALIRPGQDGFLAAVLLPDRRAMTIEVDQQLNHAGMLAPGDRVDVIFTMQVATDDPSQLNSFSRTILTDLRVIAVGQRIAAVIGTDAEAPQDGVPTVTLEVRPPEADQLALATIRGSLSLALRPLGPTNGSDRRRPPASLRTLLPPPATQPPTPDPLQVQIFRGATREEVLLPK